MKHAIVLIAIGIILLGDGIGRLVTGVVFGNIAFIVGGVLFGLLLGGYIARRGFIRLQRVRREKQQYESII